MASVIFAALSQDGIRKTGIIEYRRSHPVPALAWQCVLEHSGFARIRDPDGLSRIFKSGFPEETDAVRINRSKTVVILPPQRPEEGATFWSRTEAALLPAEQWSTLPGSLEGFEELAGMAAEWGNGKSQARPLPPVPNTGPARAALPRARSKGPKWIDPKAFHY